MTALDGIERLETPGLWRPEAGAQRRDVYVSIGEAELVVQDRAGTALSHWSLPALIRLNPDALPARYAPTEGAGEELEIAEPEMVAALDRVMDAVTRGRRRPGRLRRIAMGLAIGLTAGFTLMWLPGAVRDQAADLLPPAKHAEIGKRMLSELTLLTGPPCETVTGREALDALQARVLPRTPARIEILHDLPLPALALPGNLLVLSDRILVTQDDPDVAAGHLLAASLTGRAAPPLDAFIDRVGPVDLMRLLSAGTVTDGPITAHVEALLTDPPAVLGADALRSGFATARLAWPPYATAESLPAGDVTPSDMPPALDDPTWQQLRSICDR